MRKHVKTEIKRRMSTRFSWLLGVLVLLSIGVLVACSGSHFSASSDGLVLASTQGAALLQTFSFDLSNGHVSTISHPPSTMGVPTSLVVDPAGTFAYAIVYQSAQIDSSITGIATFSINSNGSASYIATVPPAGSDPNPVGLAMDQAGKFLFVANGATDGLDPEAHRISVYAIGSNASLTLVPGSYSFPTAVPTNFVALASTPVTFPTLNAACSGIGLPAPTAEYLYAVDSTNNGVWEFQVDMSTGTLGNPGSTTAVPFFSAATVPSGVAVDSCNRFVYVANQMSNNISAYSICNGTVTASLDCTGQDGSLVAVPGSPISVGDAPGPIAIDPFANFLYVLDTGTNQLSGFRISQVTGGLTALNPATVATGTTPKSIAIRADANWLFVANYGSASISQYAITPASGGLTPQTPITTDNNPWGVAVK
jgi:6-phosphogluconolactonase (cycloisomerase 2 family)